MPISLATNIQPRNATHPDPAIRGVYYMVEDVYFKGGLQVRNTHAERDGIFDLNRKQGMLVLTLEDDKIWKLGSDLVSWSELELGGSGGVGVRQVAVRAFNDIAPNDYLDFDLELGMTCVALKVGVSAPCIVEAYSTPARDEANPYKFIARDYLLEDDGRTQLADGTYIKNRRYSILANLEDPPTNKCYFRIINDSTSALSGALSVTFLPFE